MLKPLADRVVAKKIEQAAKTTSGLYIPPKSQETPVGATVVAIGPDVKAIKKGDTIVFKEYATTEIKVDGENFLLIKEEDILATIEKGKK